MVFTHGAIAIDALYALKMRVPAFCYEQLPQVQPLVGQPDAHADCTLNRALERTIVRIKSHQVFRNRPRYSD
jgi:hypothetical protein